jgi:hypothetical protein
MIDLCCAPACYVEYEGECYRIRTDFKIWIQFEKTLLSDLADEVKIVELLSLCYVKELPPNLFEALRLLIKFYGCGAENVGQGERIESEKERIYDFTYDAELFYAAFLEQYGIDLLESDLHWWKFLALFRSISPDTRLFKVLSWRAAKLSDISDSKQKDYIKRMKRLYRLPKNSLAKKDDADIAELISEL